MLPELLYCYGDGKPAPITVYFYFDTNCKIKDRTSYCYDIFYDKWCYYLKRIYKDSYAVPKYVWNRKYFNYNFIFIELANLIQFNHDKCKVDYCYFEQRYDYIVQLLDDDEREFKPNPMPL